MRLGLMLAMSVGGGSLEDALALTERADASGVSTVWTGGKFDALTLIALAAARTHRVELGTSIVVTYPRHPAALAQQALTVQVASSGRLTLGIGVGKKEGIEGGLGLTWSPPARHMREYLTCLRGLLAGEAVTYEGTAYRLTNHRLPVAEGVTPPSILVSALGPKMLKLAGQLADGTILWLGGLRYLEQTVMPAITDAASEAGRGTPRVVVGLPICVTSDEAAAREHIARQLQGNASQSAYRAVLEINGSTNAGDVAVVGDAEAVRQTLREFASRGATDFVGAIIARDKADWERTFEVLSSAL